jgi:2-methylcitrate dehydratase PrpD
MDTVSQDVARRVAEISFDALPEEVVERAKLLVLDQLGVQLRGARLPHVQPVRELAARSEGRAEATAVDSSVLVSASQAAWVNGTLGHSAEFDDAHMAAWHTSSAVVPAAMALAERDDRTGAEVLAAVVAGVQVMGVLGTVAGGGMLSAGWHGSKVLGVFGAAAAAGHVLSLDPARLAHAFGIAASESGGTMEYDRSGGEVKRLHAGSASRAGVEAALLAELGLTGPSTIFEGPRGVFAMFGGVAADTRPEPEQWRRWQILDTIFRFYPAIAATHPPLDALARLRAEHDFGADDVVAVNVGLPQWAVGHGAAITRPTDAISAQFSLAFGLGLQLVTGANRPQDYVDPQRWSDPRILAVADRVTPYAMPIPEGDPGLSARVELRLTDGRRLEAYQAGFHGHPVWPATEADIEEKFRANLDGIRSRPVVDALIEAVREIETLPVRKLTRMLRPEQ